ncbi:oligomeric, coiled-coil, peripheral membrane protein [Ceratobasidium sp. 414]|nr:oligomeric, coiled-coil, peripheral membrane protein [Ceratobasidium sp. 414]
MRIVAAEEGKEIEPDNNFHEIYQQGNLSLALQSLVGINPAAQLIYVQSGEQLREDNAEELLGKPDLTLYVFNQDLLGAGSHAPTELLLSPASQLPQTGHLMRDAEVCAERVRFLGTSVDIQHEALSVVMLNLEGHVMALADTFDSFRNVAQRELDRQQALLHGHKLDLEIISKVKVHPEFLSAVVRRGVEATGRERTLGDYVSNSKMQMVAQSCTKLHNDLSTRYNSVVDSFSQLVVDVAELKSSLETALCDEAALSMKQAEDCLTSLKNSSLDIGAKQRLLQIYQDICRIKDRSTEHVFSFLAGVSDVQHLMSRIPGDLAALEVDFRQKGGFPHLQRLRNMLYMYGATVVEVVRRREFNKFFMDKAQAIAEVLAKLSAHERKRRQVYRSEVHGQLPFDPRGMEEPAPTLEISTSGDGEVSIGLERQDIAAQIESTPNGTTLPPNIPHPASEARIAFERLIAKLDNLESDFDRLAGRAVLSASRIYQSRRQSTADTSNLQELIEQLRDARAAKTEQDIAFQRETAALTSEVDRLRLEAASASASKARAERLEIELDVTRTKHKTEIAARKGLEQRLKDAEMSLLTLEQNSGARTDDPANLQAARRLEELESERLNSALALEQLQARNRRLEEELQQVRRERDELNGAVREMDVQLKEQSNAAERSLRDHIAETDGDRGELGEKQEGFGADAIETAVLEQQVAELRQALDSMPQDTPSTKRLQPEITRLESENVELRAKLATLNDTLVQFASAARTLYNAHNQTLSTAHNILKASKVPTGTDANAVQSPEIPSLPTLTVEPPAALPEFDPSKSQVTLGALLALNLQALDEAVMKIGSNSRKYLKLSKEYRERSKSKITFRNFGRGDLALFLPTRNSIAKPWAAFNVAFPHYFLNATEDISELLKSREWIVARILSITERIADSKQPDGNPFGLGDGVKFFLLDVEDWTQPSNVAKKRTISNPIRPLSIASYEARERISSWSETTALATALPASVPDREDTLGAGISLNSKSGARAPSPSAGARYFSKMSVSPTAGPSSLSRVLAQAPTPTSPGPQSVLSSPYNAERSRSRTTSLSSVRPPHLNGPNKAAPTTALSERAVPAAGSTATPDDASTPSPSGSAFDGMGSVVANRRRPTSMAPGMSAGRADVVIRRIQRTPKATHITLGHNPLGDSGMASIIRYLCQPENNVSVEEINLNNCGIGDSGLYVISQYVKHNTTLRRLYLMGNQIAGTSTVAKVFADALNHSKVQTLVLTNNEMLSDNFLTRFLGALDTPYLRDLQLSRLGLTESSIPALSRFLVSPACYGLRSLHLNANMLSYTGLNKLVSRLLTGNTTLCEMEVYANSALGPGGDAVNDVAVRDTTLQALALMLARNLVYLRRVEREARALLVIARAVLLGEEGRVRFDNNGPPTFPWQSSLRRTTYPSMQLCLKQIHTPSYPISKSTHEE